MKIRTVVVIMYEVIEELLKEHKLTHNDALKKLEDTSGDFEETIRDGMGDELTNVQINIATEEVLDR